MLSDVEIEEEIRAGGIKIFSNGKIKSVSELNIQPCSVEVHLSSSDVLLADKNGPPGSFKPIPANCFFGSFEFGLASTDEYVEIGPHLSCELMGKSTLGREGMMIHVTAGLCDPGFKGQITLEILNVSPWYFRMIPGMAIGQLVFFRLGKPCRRPYGDPSLKSKYQGQTGATPSRRIP